MEINRGNRARIVSEKQRPPLGEDGFFSFPALIASEIHYELGLCGGAVKFMIDLPLTF